MDLILNISMVYQIDKALLEGVPLAEGHYMRDMDLKEFKRIFYGLQVINSTSHCGTNVADHDGRSLFIF